MMIFTCFIGVVISIFMVITLVSVFSFHQEKWLRAKRRAAADAAKTPGVVIFFRLSD